MDKVKERDRGKGHKEVCPSLEEKPGAWDGLSAEERQHVEQVEFRNQKQGDTK